VAVEAEEPSRIGRWHPRLSVCAYSSRQLSLHEDLALYRRLGVERVALSLSKIVEAGVDAAVDSVLEAGLHVDGLVSVVRFDLSDPTGWEEQRRQLLDALDVAQRLGATVVQTTGGTARGARFEPALEAFAEAIAPVLGAAIERGVRVALEPTRPQFAHASFVHSLAQGLAVARQLDLQLVVDTVHGWWEPGYGALLAEAAPVTATVQIGDLRFDGPVVERVVPGDGELDLAATFACLLGADYGGPFELEILGRAVEEEGYERAIERSLVHLDAILRRLDA